MKYIIDSHSISPLLRNELYLMRQNLFSLSGFSQLLVPTLLYIILTIIYFNNAYTIHEPIEPIAVSLLFPLFSIVGFPSIYMTPIVRKDMNYIWVYRLYRRNMKRWILIKIASSIIYCILSLIISTLIIILSLEFLYGLNYFNFINPSVLLLTCIFIPIPVCFLGYFLSVCLPDVYYSTQNQVSFIISVVFIWIQTLICLPFIFCIYKIQESSYYYIMFYCYFLVITFIISKFIQRNLSTKEL